MQMVKYFNIPYNGQHDITIKTLGKYIGDVPRAYGMWHILLGMLYDSDGVLSVKNSIERDLISEELSLISTEISEIFEPFSQEFDGTLDAFLHALAYLNLINLSSLHRGKIINKGVVEELEYRQDKRTKGKSAAEKKKEKNE